MFMIFDRIFLQDLLTMGVEERHSVVLHLHISSDELALAHNTASEYVGMYYQSNHVEM